MEIIFNGEPRQFSDGMTVAQLLHELQLNPRYLAVELNLHVVPRAQHAERTLQANDRLEVVTLVGGG
ncbi:MAG: sulfur carrier protein ThiS [Pirellulales bacterium]